MNGIDFIVRDRSGFVPDLPKPRSRFRWTEPRPRIVSQAELRFIRESRGRITCTELAACYGVSDQTICNIWKNPDYQPKQLRPAQLP